jgi:hypothetical protein
MVLTVGTVVGMELSGTDALSDHGSSSAKARANWSGQMLQTNKSKNDPTARGSGGDGKTFDGKKVKPVLYVGTAVGHGRYIAVQDEAGKMIIDREGKPIAFRDI